MVLRATALEKARSMVGVALHALGADPETAATGTDTWVVGKGKAAILVRLVVRRSDDDEVHLQVVSPLMRAAPDRAFLEKLLQLNHEMGGLAAFCITPAQEVHLVAARNASGYAAPDIARVIALVAHFTEQHHDDLLRTFGPHLALGQRTAAATHRPSAPPARPVDGNGPAPNAPRAARKSEGS